MGENLAFPPFPITFTKPSFISISSRFIPTSSDTLKAQEYNNSIISTDLNSLYLDDLIVIIFFKSSKSIVLGRSRSIFGVLIESAGFISSPSLSIKKVKNTLMEDKYLFKDFPDVPAFLNSMMNRLRASESISLKSLKPFLFRNDENFKRSLSYEEIVFSA